jgi:uncharacterized protein YodC (DUF2158 family)
MSEEFKIGDVVELKSGGPKMTIDNIGDYSLMGSAGHDQAHCVWFEKTKRITGTFEFAVLKKVD